MAIKQKIHPYKFTLWVAIGSIVMMFAGLTSAYIVKRSQANWQGFELPLIFTYATAIILLSSVTMHFALRSLKQQKTAAYRLLLIITGILGILFVVLQWNGFKQLNEHGIKLIGRGSNVSGSFLAVIASLHMLHVLGGVLALLAILGKAFSKSGKFNLVAVEVLAQYWHFVDFLWIYLFIFLQMAG